MADILVPSRQIFFCSDGFGIEPKVHAKSGGGKIYQGVAVFRSGTFRDSSGTQNTWEDIHIKQMMENYTHLRNKNILQSVPARDGHPGFIVNNMQGKGNVVGWHNNLEAKTLKSPISGEEHTYLLADYEVTEPYAQEKIANGTWRNRSAEIGYYTTNEEAEFWPVYLGFAFVDFSAVEGLNFSMSQGNRFFSFSGGKNIFEESTVAGTDTGTMIPVAIPSQAPVQPTAPAAPASPFVFSVGGQNVTDPNVVQATINRYEQFFVETRAAMRGSFVKSLVAANKITAPQEAGMAEFASKLSDEMYESWVAQWNLAPVAPILGVHASGVTNPDNKGATGSATPDPLANAREIVKMHQRAGMPMAELQATPSYKAIILAGQTV